MPDNIDVTAGSGTTIAADEVASALHQRIKLSLGADGSATDALGGAGSASAGVMRTVTASDSPEIALLTAIQTAVEIIDNAISGSEMQVDLVGSIPAGTNNIGDVDVLTLPALPAGSNNIGDVDVATVPTDPFGADADAAAIAGSISAKLRSLATNIDNAVSGNEMQVDVVGALPAGDNNIGNVDVVTLPALPAGTNNIGDVDVLTLPALPAGTNNIGDVDVVSHVPGTAATNLGKAEDGAHTSGDTGVAVLGVRRDSKAVGSGTDGDYSTLNLNDSGDLRVDGGQVYSFESAPTVTSGAYTADDLCWWRNRNHKCCTCFRRVRRHHAGCGRH